MANRNPRPVGQPADFNPRGLLPEGLLPVARPTGEDAAHTSQAFERIAHAFDRYANEAAAAEGDRAGDIAGADPRFRPTGGVGIRSRAYNAAGLKVYAQKLDAQLRADVLATYDKNKSDPGNIVPALDQLYQDYQGEHVIPEIKGHFDAQFIRLRTPLARAAAAMLEAKDNADLVSSIMDNVQASRAFLSEASKAATASSQASAAVSAEMSHLQAVLAAGVKAGNIEQPVADEIARDAAHGAATNAVMAGYERLPSRDARERFVDDLGGIASEFSGSSTGTYLGDLKRSLKARLDDEALAQAREDNSTDAREQGAAAVSGYRLMRDGTLAPEWIAANADALSPSTQKQLAAAAAAPGAEASDPSQYAELLDAAIDDPRRAVAGAAEAFRRGDLSRDDFDRVYDAAARFDEQVQQRPWALDMRRDVLTMLKPGPMQAPQFARRQLDAAREFDDWLDKNPAATSGEAHEAADTIVSRARINVTKAERSSLPMPRFAVAARDAFGGNEVVMVGQRLREARSAEQLSDDEFVAEVELLQRWQDLVAREPRRGK